MEAEQAAKTPGEAGGREVAKYGYYVLHVKDLTFVPRKTFARTATDFLRRYLTGVEIGWILPSLKKLDKDSHHDAPLHRVHFSFKSGEVTALLGDKNERHTLINLLTGRQKTGQFDGDISLTGPGLRPDSYYYDNMAFVQSVSRLSYCYFSYFWISFSFLFVMVSATAALKSPLPSDCEAYL